MGLLCYNFFFFLSFSFCLKIEQIMEQNLILLALKKKTNGVPNFFFF